MRNIKKEKKNGDSMFCNGVTRENARACSYARFCIKCFNMTWNVCKINLRRFWAFKNFAHALTRGRTRTRAFFDLKLTGLILTLIMINMNVKIPFGYEDMIMRWFSKNFTKWRLDDVISQGQGWKTYRVLSICLYICVPNIKDIWLNHFQSYLATQKSGSK